MRWCATHTHAYTHTRTPTHAPTHAHTHAYTRTHVHPHTHTHTHAHTHTPQAAQMLDAVQIRHITTPVISSHSSLHGELLPYSELTKWLRDSEPLRFSEVMEVRGWGHGGEWGGVIG